MKKSMERRPAETRRGKGELRRGLVQVYTGEGKGKTTAAVGLALRAAGSNLKVGFFQFFKKPVSGELVILKNINNIHIYNLARLHPDFQYFSKEELKKYKENFLRTWEKNVMVCIRKNRYDLIILDEILIAIRDSFISENKILSMIDEQPPTTEIVLTGRHITEKIMQKADIITDMRKTKHPFPDKGPRKGIDY